jgi:biopolymer transport protein ExbD
MGPKLLTEKRMLEAKKKSVAESTVIIRADGTTKTGVVQELIKKCQDNSFEKFALRVKQEKASGP